MATLEITGIAILCQAGDETMTTFKETQRFWTDAIDAMFAMCRESAGNTLPVTSFTEAVMIKFDELCASTNVGACDGVGTFSSRVCTLIQVRVAMHVSRNRLLFSIAVTPTTQNGIQNHVITTTMQPKTGQTTPTVQPVNNICMVVLYQRTCKHPLVKLRAAVPWYAHLVPLSYRYVS